MAMRRDTLLLLLIAALPIVSAAQSLTDSGISGRPVASTPQVQPDLPYIRPPQSTKLRNYVFDAFGPYPIVGAGVAAGINQWQNTPPEWKQRIFSEGVSQGVTRGGAHRCNAEI